MPLNGTLKDISLPNLVQLQCTEQKRAQVSLTRRNIEGALVFAEGVLLYAQFGPLAGEDAVYEMLGWDEGNFHVSETLTRLPPRNVSASWQSLVLEGLRRADEIKSDRAESVARVSAEIRRLDGINTWRLCTVDGQEINASGESTVSHLAEWTARVLQEATGLGQALATGNVTEMIFANPKKKRLLVSRGRFWVAIETSSNAALTAARDALARANKR